MSAFRDKPEVKPYDGSVYRVSEVSAINQPLILGRCPGLHFAEPPPGSYTRQFQFAF